MNNMMRHPIYLGLCLFSAAYLALANSRGWSVGHVIGAPFGRSLNSTRTMNHK
jgi:protein-S-isoprenylcysteine O-methyltransferase Ste14